MNQTTLLIVGLGLLVFLSGRAPGGNRLDPRAQESDGFSLNFGLSTQSSNSKFGP